MRCKKKERESLNSAARYFICLNNAHIHLDKAVEQKDPPVYKYV